MKGGIIVAILEAKNIQKIYTTRFGGNRVRALSNVSFSVEQGEYVAIMGESGSGKTTLLNLLAALDRPTNGEVLLDGKNVSSITFCRTGIKRAGGLIGKNQFRFCDKGTGNGCPLLLPARNLIRIFARGKLI